MHLKRLWSDALQCYIRVRVTTRVLRTLDKVGGLDEYLLGDKAARIKELGMGGWKLRWRIMQTDKVKERFRLQREMLGLPPKEESPRNSKGQRATKLEVSKEIEQFDTDLVEGVEVDIGEDVEKSVGTSFMQEEPMQQGKVVL